jgi:creatinine amidohydrolase
MRWEELTSDEFPQAVAQAESVCLLPLSCIERHAHHLPMGTDMYIARDLCRRTTEIEPAVIFPDYIFTQILEARHQPGTIAIKPDLIVSLLENVCEEIARNGLKKIVIVNAHGGNNYLIHFFAQIQLASPRDYVVYVASPPVAPEDEVHWQPGMDGHAGAGETSDIMAIRPDLVHRDKIYSDGEGNPQGRLKALRDVRTDMGIWWYADYPHHFSGDATPATAESGERDLVGRARALAKVIRLIKDDTETKRLQDEFFSRSQH